jgi:hypothetical protein
LFTPQTTARLCVLAHHLLIWRGNERIAGSNVLLKRQDPTPKGEELSQSQSLSPICEDINKMGAVKASLFTRETTQERPNKQTNSTLYHKVGKSGQDGKDFRLGNTPNAAHWGVFTKALRLWQRRLVPSLGHLNSVEKC